jgi:LysM repeat protein
VPSIVQAPRSAAGADPDSRRNAVYLSVLGLSVLLLAIVVVAVTALTGPDAATTAAQARARTLDKLPVYWKVHTGDSYGKIAEKTGLTVDDLETFNPHVDPGAIVPGQKIKLRLHVPKPKPKPLGPRTHTVRSGETYASIAARTGHSMLALQQLNPKLHASALQPGDRVRLRR